MHHICLCVSENRAVPGGRDEIKFSVGKEYRSRLMAGGYPVQNSKASQDIKENQKR